MVLLKLVKFSITFIKLEETSVIFGKLTVITLSKKVFNIIIISVEILIGV